MSKSLPESARCLHCDYPLRGLREARCPECGQAFDENDPTSFCDPAHPDRTRGARLRPTPVAWLVLVAGTCIVLAIGLALPDVFPELALATARTGWISGLPDSSGYVVAWIAFILGDYVLRVVRLRHLRQSGKPHLLAEFNAHAHRWRTHSTLVLLLILTIAYPWPTAARFILSWPILKNTADQYVAGAPPIRQPTWIGLWYCDYVWGRGQDFVWFRFWRDEGHRYGLVRYDVAPQLVQTPQVRPRIWLAPGWYFERW